MAAAAAEEAKQQQLKIVMFPWLAFGHMIPFLELSKNLAQRGHHIIYLSTTRNINRLPPIPHHLSPLIDLIPLELPRIADNPLPLNADSTADLPADEVQFLKKAYDLLHKPVSHVLESSHPDWVIYDFSCHWLPPTASKLGIKQAFFSIFLASTLTFIVGPEGAGDADQDQTVPPSWITFPSRVFFRRHEARKVMRSVLEVNASGASDIHRVVSAHRNCDAILVRSCREIEGKYLDLMEEIHGKPVLPVGLLPPPSSLQGNRQDDDGDNGGDWGMISGWLDRQDEGSVVYVAFGSEAIPTQDELVKLASGLEQSGLAFFWALKKVARSSSTEYQKIKREPLALPDGFEERTRGRGMIWTSWAPQVRILCHRAIGGFLSHCGWSSVIEGVQVGRPLILFPMFGDQGLIARILEEMKVGCEVARDEEDGSFMPEAVAESLRLVVVEEEGEIYRRKAKEASGVIGDAQLHDQYVEQLVQFLIDRKTIGW